MACECSVITLNIATVVLMFFGFWKTETNSACTFSIFLPLALEISNRKWFAIVCVSPSVTGGVPGSICLGNCFGVGHGFGVASQEINING